MFSLGLLAVCIISAHFLFSGCVDFRLGYIRGESGELTSGLMGDRILISFLNLPAHVEFSEFSSNRYASVQVSFVNSGEDREVCIYSISLGI